MINKCKTNVYGSGRQIIGDRNLELGCKDEGKSPLRPRFECETLRTRRLTELQFLDTNINP